jgi:hypothetical protein
LLPRASLAKGLLLAGSGAKAGGALLALAVIASSPDPAVVLGLLAIALLVVGGTTWMRGRPGSVLIRFLISLGTIILARLTLGPSGAGAAAVLLTMGAWLRLGLPDAVVGLALFGGMVALLGSASPRLALVFWAIGLAIVLLRRLAARVWRHVCDRRSLTAETTTAVSLRPES